MNFDSYCVVYFIRSGQKTLNANLFHEAHSQSSKLVSILQGMDSKVEQVCEKKIKKKNIEKHEKWKQNLPA